MRQLSALIVLCSVIVPMNVATIFAQEEAADKPETHTVEKGLFRVEVELEGVFEAAEMAEVVLRPDEWSSLVVERAVDQGTVVEKGQPIIWLETEDIDDTLRTTEFALELGRLSIATAESELATLEVTVPLDLHDAERDKEIADLELEHFNEVDEEMSRRSAEESLKSSEYSLEYAMEELEQLEKMYLADDLTEETEEIILKRARRDVERSQFFLENARIRHERTLEEDIPRERERVEEAAERATTSLDKARVALPASLEQKRIELQKLRNAQEELQQKFERLQQDRESLVVKAPAAGVVYYGHCDRGQWPAATTMARQLRQGGSLSANQVIMTIITPGTAFVRVTIDEKDLRFSRPGTEGVVIPTAFPDDRLRARVIEIESIPVQSGKFDGKVEFAMEQGQLPIVPAMNAKVKLTGYENAAALTVPSSAVFSEEADETQKYVYVQPEEGEPEKRTVQVGHSSGDKTEITAGLEEGEEILLKKPEE